MRLLEQLHRTFFGRSTNGTATETPPPDSWLLGTDSTTNRPQYVPESHDECHWWCTGATRCGKTSRFILPTVRQRLAQNKGPVIVADMKGEDWLFQAVKEDAERLGRRFLWLTNCRYFSTYLFNPLNQLSFDQLTIPQFAQVILNALGLFYGPGYGKAHFSAQSRRCLADALELNASGDPHNEWMPSGNESLRIRSFDDIRKRVIQKSRKGEDLRDVSHLITVLEDLAKIMNVNFVYQGHQLPKSAVDAAIQIQDLLLRDEAGNYPVLYLHMRAGMESVGAPQVVKLILHCVFIASMQAQDFYKLGIRKQPPPTTSMILDEWQNIADHSIKNVIETASGQGLQFVFANQDMSQLKSRDIDLAATVWENAGNKVVFTARDPQLLKTLSYISGEKTVYEPSYTVSHPAWKAGRTSPRHALHVINGQWAPIHVSERLIPCLGVTELTDMSTSPDQFLYIPAYKSPEHKIDGVPVVLRGQYVMSLEQYKKLREMPWPEATPETIIPSQLAAAATGTPKPNQAIAQ